ncbi:hypothetical protein DWB61_02850 [Ancylomarina euxinus]|uniref:Transglutaminase-like domain-containing protein n=1 Tax=Ancylomarina euxinus TaxID=2283627 RepID=A0A425Y713_9BACT|nr:transglutaminase domain-containing protein [Ancylomarina euxinus]MCZ4694058.1 hypothetical protein [Ancylomarina euxinus]MUP14522.1 hypothetical protein [Ancylomarina euxinus]RRG24072.1 hypothetical protein DWB61_02850 [Ancylomarina euxinus]
MKRIISLILIIGFSFTLKAQKSRKLSHVDKIMHQISDSSSHYTQSIADYVNTEFVTQKEKARAIFFWIAKNIYYDCDSMFSYSNLKSDEILKTRKGVCRDFTNLYSEIANKVGIKTYIITGYTRELKLVNYNMHAWCASMIDSTWYLIDPTWGSGSIKNNLYIKDLNNDYFMMRPERFIKTHIPFDPLWQFSNYPITKREFHESKSKASKRVVSFNFINTLKAYEKQTEIERLISICSRIKSNGISCYLDYDNLQHLRAEIQKSYDKINTEYYNLALKNFNEGIILSNEYIDYKNKYYIPYKSDEEIKEMLDEVDQLFNLSLSQLKLVKNVSSNLKINVDYLYISIDKALNDLNDTKMKLGKYLKIAKEYRKSLSTNKEFK